MNTPSASIRDRARRLLALEAAIECTSHPRAHEAVRVCEKLRISLTRFAGADGFTALLRRALVLAQAEVLSLQTVKVTADGRLEGLEGFDADAESPGVEAATAIIAHLLWLLVTFVGEPITLRLTRDAWPGVLLDE